MSEPPRLKRRYSLQLALVVTFAIIIVPASLWLGAQPGQPGPSTLDWYTLHKAQLNAAGDDKKIMVLLTKPPCADCRKLQNVTLADTNTVQRINDYFYPVKVRVDSTDSVQFNGMEYANIEFADSFGVTAYPTLLFFDSNGRIISQQGGFMSSRILRKVLCYIGSDAYKKMEFDQYTIQSKN